MVRRWGQSIAIEAKPIFIAVPDSHHLSALHVADGNETSTTLKTVNGRVATPYKEQTDWVEKCACNIMRQGQACMSHEFKCISE
jgi:hypothetical protein